MTSRASGAIHFALGFALVLSGSYAEAREELEPVVELAERFGDVLLRVRALAYLTVAHRRLRRLDETRAVAERTIALSAEHALDHYLGAGKANLGWVLYVEGKYSEAKGHLTEALRCWQRARIIYPFQGLALWPLAGVLETEGRWSQIISDLQFLVEPSQQRLPSEIESVLSGMRRSSAEGVKHILGTAREHRLL